MHVQPEPPSAAPQQPPSSPPVGYPPPGQPVGYQPPGHAAGYPPPGHAAAWGLPGPAVAVVPGPSAVSPRTGLATRWVVLTGAVCGVVGLALGAALGALGVLAAQGGEDDWEHAGAAQDRLAERLPALVAFVEDRTGRAFTEEPVVEVLDDDAFERALTAPTSSGPQVDPHDDFAATAEALGLTADADRYASDADTGWVDSVAGFYDPATDRLVVRGTEWTPSVETTVVHELVHALQDQHVDLDAVTAATRDDDDSYLALSAISEGHAGVVESDWLTEQGTDYEDRYWADDAYAGVGPAEPLSDVLTYLPYELGWAAVVELEGRAGTEAVWQALAVPPTTLEQVWDTAAWRDGDPLLADAVVVPAPQASSEDVVDTGSLGVHLLTLLTVADPEEWFFLEEPLEGWAGDAYVTWDDGGRTCTALHVVLDREDEALALSERLGSWVEDGGTVTAPTATERRLERCTD